MSTKSRRISITGLGYVGLPVAVAFAKTQQVIAFDTNLDRLNELRKHHDRNHEIDADTLANAHLVLTDSLEDLKTADFHIVATPTPIDQDNEPDLSMLEAASQQIGRVLKAVVSQRLVHRTDGVGRAPAVEAVTPNRRSPDLTPAKYDRSYAPGGTISTMTVRL